MVLAAFAAAKVVTLVAVVVSVAHHAGTVTWASLSAAFSHWDAVAYLDIAGHGYPGQLDYHDAFLPGYPLLVRAMSRSRATWCLPGSLSALWPRWRLCCSSTSS